MKNVIMQSLLAEFAPGRSSAAEAAAVVAPDASTASVTTAAADDAITNRCARCGGTARWQPLGSDQWYCTHCDPPPSASMIGQEIGAPSATKIIDSIAYAVGTTGPQTVMLFGNPYTFDAFLTRPVCTCGSHHITEHRWSDCQVTFECSSCGMSLPDPEFASV